MTPNPELAPYFSIVRVRALPGNGVELLMRNNDTGELLYYIQT